MAPAITDLKILVGDQPLPANLKKIPVDLNAGAGGEYLWLAYEQDETKGPESWVTGLDVIEGPNAKPPDGYTKDDTNLNAGAVR